MLTVKDLEEFENYMRSGELETDFKDGCENDRYYLLELLEKFMDVAELADETATKVIFRGQIGLLAVRGPPPKVRKSNGKDIFEGRRAFLGRAALDARSSLWRNGRPLRPLEPIAGTRDGPLAPQALSPASFRKGPACHRQTGPLPSSGYVFARTPLPYASMPGRDSTSCMAAQRRSTSSRGLT